MEINVKEILGVVETQERIFIKAQGPDKKASAQRFAVTEGLLEQWYQEINRTNLRELPDDLFAAYEEGATAMCKILMLEKEIISRN